jgi:hypothetical protein
METLLDILGHAGVAAAALVLAAPLGAIGWWLRRGGRRGLERLQRIEGARARIGDIRAGAVTLVGKWSATGAGRGLLQDADGRAVVVEHDGAAPESAEAFLVSGTAVGEVDDPRAVDFRTRARLWRIETRTCGFYGDEKQLLGAAHRAARRGSGLGAALFASAVALAMAGVVVAVRAYLGWSEG